MPDFPFIMTKVSFESDTPFDADEFYYLTDFKAGQQTTDNDIIKAHGLLSLKNRFKEIIMTTTSHEKGYHLHVKLVGHWIFKKLIIKNVVLGKQRYTSLYRMRPGDIFSTQLHEQSLENIKTHLKEEGHLQATIEDEFSFDEKSKTITTTLSITSGPVFRIGSIKLSFNDKVPLKKQYLTDLKKILIPIQEMTCTKIRVTQMLQSIKKTLASHGFEQTRINILSRINPTESTVALAISIHTHKKNLAIEGNKAISKRFLIDAVADQSFPEWLMQEDLVVERLCNEYRLQGFFDPSITYTCSKHRSLFHIEENQPFAITSVKISGTDREPDNAQNLMYWQELLNLGTYHEKLINKGRKLLREGYIKKGYWDIEISPANIVKESVNTGHLIMSVTYGPQRVLKSVIFKNYTPKKLSLSTPQKPYPPLNHQMITQQREVLLAELYEQGYWYATLDSHLTEEPPLQDGSIPMNITWDINKGNPISFGKLIVRGNTKLPFSTIKNSCSFSEGYSWNDAYLEQTRTKLSRLGVFGYSQLTPYDLTQKESTKNIIVTVFDDEPFELRLHGGLLLSRSDAIIQRNSGLTAGGTLIVKNPLNKADKLLLGMDYERYNKRVNVEYHQPGCLGLAGEFYTTAHASRSLFPLSIIDNSVACAIAHSGIQAGITHDYSSHIHMNFSSGCEWIKTHDADNHLQLAPHLLDTLQHRLFFETKIKAHFLRENEKVIQGFATQATLHLIAPTSSNLAVPLCKFIIEHTYFKPLIDPITLAIKIRTGRIWGQELENIIPLDRFFLGGTQSVRGYIRDTLPPLKQIMPEGHKEPLYIIQGGRSMVNLSLEVLYRFKKNLSLLAFCDAGRLGKTPFNKTAGQWYPASGLGLRFHTPLGSLKFDVGWKWAKAYSEENSYNWHLSFEGNF